MSVPASSVGGPKPWPSAAALISTTGNSTEPVVTLLMLNLLSSSSAGSRIPTAGVCLLLEVGGREVGLDQVNGIVKRGGDDQVLVAIRFADLVVIFG